VGVSLINPGFVETPLTAQNSFKMPALITPEQAALADRARLGGGATSRSTSPSASPVDQGPAAWADGMPTSRHAPLHGAVI
jgi:hypothetical protein